MDNQIPMLTEIIEAGDSEKSGLHRPEINAETIATALTDDDLNQKIEHAIDAVLPVIKRRLHQQLLSALSKEDNQSHS